MNVELTQQEVIDAIILAARRKECWPVNRGSSVAVYGKTMSDPLDEGNQLLLIERCTVILR